MALGKLKKGSRQFIVPKLQITSMMDMFTIILIFLLFSFSNNPEAIELNKDLQLPESEAKLDYKENIELVLSRSNLKLENEVIAEIKNGKIIGLNPKELKQSNLYRQLKAYREKADKNELILFLCDKRLPFNTINTIMKTAAMAGYPNFQFGVLKK